MTFLWLCLVVVFICSFFARFYSTSIQFAGVTAAIKPNKAFVFAALVALVAVSGLRSNIGDTFFYKYAYELNDFTWEYVLSEKDIGFGILQMILKNYVSEDPQILVFTTALVTNVLIVLTFYKYSRMIELSLYVYITSGLFIVTMNGIRQSLAAAIVFMGTKFIIDGKWLPYFLIVIFASFFHQSALLLIPIYFIARFKAWSKATYALLIFAIIIVVGFDQFSSILFKAIEDTQYGHYKDFQEGGANILRVFVAAAPLIIAFSGREKLKTIFPGGDVFINMSLIGLLFIIIATQNWIFARFTIYFDLYHLILISWIVKVFRDKDQKLIYLGILLCYLVFFFYENVITLQLEYRSDFLKWNFS
jgi:transmembrane protein EpsG